jgi:hypothetical protein
MMCTAVPSPLGAGLRRHGVSTIVPWSSGACFVSAPTAGRKGASPQVRLALSNGERRRDGTRPLSSSRFEGDLLSWSYCRPPYDDCQLRAR